MFEVKSTNNSKFKKQVKSARKLEISEPILDLSIITPTYNGERFLSETIKSVLSQSFGNFEYILIDDGSRDRSPEIAKEFMGKDSRIKIFREEKNLGKSFVLNKGIENSSGRIISFIDQDDIYLENGIRFLFDSINKRNADFTYGDILYIDENSRTYSSRRIFEYNNQNLFKILLKRPIFQFSAIMLKRKIFEEIGLFDENYLTADDWEFYLRASRANLNIRHCGETVTAYRSHPDNYSKILRKNGENLRWTFQLVDDYTSGIQRLNLKIYHFFFDFLKRQFEKLSDKKIEYNPLNLLRLYFKKN